MVICQIIYQAGEHWEPIIRKGFVKYSHGELLFRSSDNVSFRIQIRTHQNIKYHRHTLRVLVCDFFFFFFFEKLCNWGFHAIAQSYAVQYCAIVQNCDIEDFLLLHNTLLLCNTVLSRNTVLLSNTVQFKIS